ncbi:MAG: F0F1 ATP synthase subunit B [Clostridia bacterium]|nr:F0F1 ATP synthase subunit B [Clostridia bacterium]MBR2886003.1 F0F1 ATP synthase subunit B [Clostridia bacterium]
MEFVSIDTWTIIFTWINLIILMFVMKKLLFKPVMKMLAERENEVGSMYEKAESAQQNAEKLEGEYTQKLSEAKEEAARIMKDATDAANKKGEQIVFEAQQKASASILKAQKEIEREKLNAVSEIKKDIASIAVSVAEKVIEKDINEKDYERLVEEFIESSGEEK